MFLVSMRFYSKSRNLELLKNMITKAIVPDQISFREEDFLVEYEIIREEILRRGWDKIEVIVRSSCGNEDCYSGSMAGKYLSVRAKGIENIFEAVKQVMASMDNSGNDNNVFIQPYIPNIIANGVVFGIDPKTNGDYMVINFNESSNNESFITSGKSNNDSLYYIYNPSVQELKINDKYLRLIIELVMEIEDIYSTKKIDIEFVIDSDEKIYLLQIRPLVIKEDFSDTQEQVEEFYRCKERLKSYLKKTEYYYGKTNILGMMPDWNPVEIIGVKPNKLAYSLYDMVLMKSAWEIGRSGYGYKKIKNPSLMVDVLGSPFIDVRKSFNSFLPNDLSEELSEKVVNYYLDKLKQNPKLHDKVEFSIVHSCYAFDTDMSDMKENDFTQKELDEYRNCLLKLTDEIISSRKIYEDYICVKKLNKIRNSAIGLISTNGNSFKSKLDVIKILIMSCIEYGTVPFSGVARAAFIAEQFLQSLVNCGVFSKEDYLKYKSENNCVTSNMLADVKMLGKNEFLQKYGHLRPGTYDITQKRYDEYDIETLIKVNDLGKIKKASYEFTEYQKTQIDALISKNGFSFDVNTFIEFLSDSIKYRERIKFEFSKNVSEVLRIIKSLANDINITVEDISKCSIDEILECCDCGDLKDIVEKNRLNNQMNIHFMLPELIFSDDDLAVFKMLNNDGNFITNRKSSGEIVELQRFTEDICLDEKIVILESADPGFDWIFTHKISGFITKYGGANSHMAIRANELAIPAIIGVGEQNYINYKSSKRIEIDCLQRRVVQYE
ncbi:MAG: hypothetical protein IJJ59_03370 [Pseudobutyrivibrio sp.]|uniref:PEP/pyruvate-binding domain-containing protein n=1 Tax=Pseudobutyrivibrio sp. TaxID=2014367 RepID=UPI0025E9C47C|nr:PEP/pyruvate-binding domain-containing protein [Pseudobutyrivibrio sp.]MBQ6462345.1 hypothetical protein [Pseudobutyrivibrio sp.]